MTRITQQELESYLWGAATRLRGTIDAGDYKQFIFPLLFFKRLSDVYDEEVVEAMERFDGDEEAAMLPENHRFQIPEGAHWSDVRETNKDMGRAIQKAMRDIEAANPDKLAGIFGDAQWTNKDRLSDSMLRDLIEHFSSLDLTIANLPEDELGNGYEYLIKKFADDSGHTAAEFYTNRTVVHLMTEMLQPQPGESIYDPTCGSGGMILSAVAHLKNQGKEWRNVRLYGQERNLMTSSIARMNCFLHGIEEFDIQRGDTLSDPKFVKGDKLQKFDVVFANPPYSIKQWDREAFASDKWGRNKYGTPPQGRADYAFWQHIIASMDPKTGRCAILFPHGVLFRKEEEEMRRKLIEADLIECVVGLGGNLFYNSAMEACIVICRLSKPKGRKRQMLLIDASTEVQHDRDSSRLSQHHIERIAATYRDFENRDGFARIVSMSEVLANGANLNIALYVGGVGTNASAGTGVRLNEAYARLRNSSSEIRARMAELAGIEAPSLAPLCPIIITARLGRATWTTARLGDVAIRDASKVKLNGSEVQLWVGADHLDEGDLHVRRWSDTNDPLLPPTFQYTFKAGHVLLHSRNPKKVGIPDFNGITGEKLFVLKPRDESVLLPDFLAFILLSDHFARWVERWMSGSVNKFLNWSALEAYEIPLPPLDVQRRIADLAWAFDASGERTREAAARVEELRHAIWHAATRGRNSVPVGEIAKVANGSTPSRSQAEFWHQGTVPWLPTGKVHDRFIKAADEHVTQTAVDQRKARVFPKGSILVAMIGQGKTRGSAALLEIDSSINQNFACVTPQTCDSNYLFYALDFSYARLRKSAHGSNQEALNCAIIARFPVPEMDLPAQRTLGLKLRACDELATALKSHARATREAMGHFLEEVLG